MANKRKKGEETKTKNVIKVKDSKVLNTTFLIF